jgi:hypothetical protein
VSPRVRPRLLELERRLTASFLTVRAFDAGSNPEGVAVGDFNGDGIPDLAVADVGTSPGYTDGSVSVLLGNGDGSFQAPVCYAAGTYSLAVAVGDFNGDGWPDLAVANTLSNDVSILLNDGLWTGAPSSPAGRRNPGPIGHGSTPPTLHHPAAEVPPADAALADLPPPAPAVPGVGVAPALPPRSLAGPVSPALPAATPAGQAAPPEARPRPTALRAPPPLLNLGFAEALAPGLDGRLLGDRGALLT